MKRFTLTAPAVIVIAGLAGWVVATGQPAGAVAGDEPANRVPADGTHLPEPDPEFQGKIGETYKDSTPDYPQPVKAPKGSPNVLLILLDDVGFGMCSTFGGPVATPNLQKLADNGLSYTRFHTTALCSPTRAACSPGGTTTPSAPASSSRWAPATRATPASSRGAPRWCRRCLSDNGYATAMFGKWHNTPEPEISPAGPFDRWPTGLGFDYFYGFNQGEANQFYPTLYRNTDARRPAEDPGGRLPLHRRHDRRGHRLDPERPRGRPRQALVRLLQHRRPSTPRTTSRPTGGASTRASSTTAGTSSAS